MTVLDDFAVPVGYFEGSPNTNTVTFRDHWGDDAFHAPDAAAITIVTFTSPSARILDADTELNLRTASNPRGFVFATDGRTNAADLPTIVTHEIGHTQGLAHSGERSAVMWYSAGRGEQRVHAAGGVGPCQRIEFGQHAMDELDAYRGRGTARLTHRMDCRAGVLDRQLGDVVGLPAGQRRRCLLLTELGEVHVVDDLADQIRQGFDQGHLGVGVAGDAERFQHDVAELMSGGDGGRVEVGQRVPEPRRTPLPFRGRHLQQMGDQVVGGLVGRGVQQLERLQQLRTHPFAQLPGGGAAEGHQQHLVQCGNTFGDVAGDQRGQREGLARAGAGLEHRGGPRLGQRTVEVERLHARGSRSAASSGVQIRVASAPNRVVSPRISSPDRGGVSRVLNGARSPQARAWASSPFSANSPPAQ